jgi:hypothetical protein
MTLRFGKERKEQDVRPYVIIVEESTFRGEPDKSVSIKASGFDKEAHKKEYDRQLQCMKEFHIRLTDWISQKGISDDVRSLEEPRVPIGSLVLLCTPASAQTIEQMPGVKAVLQEP